MKNLLWAKGRETDVDARIMAFCAGEDVILDRQLFAYDLEASQAHVRGLARIGVVEDAEARAITESLDALEREFADGSFVLDARFEDGHSAIEVYLTEQLGEVGKKVHTGRSRNDQVLVATRLFLRDVLSTLQAVCVEIAQVCLERGEAMMHVPMPGYTHLQRAVPSSVGLWFAAFAEGFVDNAALACSTREWVDANPLGTAAGYGVNVALDRAFVTAELGFARTQLNPIYAQNSRGKFELQVLSSFGQALLDLRRLAWDLSLFSTAEFAFVRLSDPFTTGSSIMPNKRNPDVVELMRAAYATVAGARVELESLTSLPSGYHRDLQNTKPPLLRAVNHALQALALLPPLLRDLSFDEAVMRAAISDDLYATDVAIELTASGVAFRDAYRMAAAEPERRAGRTPEASLKARVSPGACAQPMLEVLSARLAALR